MTSIKHILNTCHLWIRALRSLDGKSHPEDDYIVENIWFLKHFITTYNIYMYIVIQMNNIYIYIYIYSDTNE